MNDLEALYHIPSWAKKHEHSFVPPICNKLMYGAGQLKVMFVGGPNTRKDFHLDEGEELFYQMKGNIELPIMERGVRKVVKIDEGYIFLLPSCIPHSPQRPETGSLGLVLERERIQGEEWDAMRWYCDPPNENQILYEKWFYCYALGKQLGPIVDTYLASNEHKNRVPAGNISSSPPMVIDEHTRVAEPIHLQSWIESHAAELRDQKTLYLYQSPETTVMIQTGLGDYTYCFDVGTWLYQIRGGCEVMFPRSSRASGSLTEEMCCYVPAGVTFTVCRSRDTVGMIATMKPREKRQRQTFMDFRSMAGVAITAMVAFWLGYQR